MPKSVRRLALTAPRALPLLLCMLTNACTTDTVASLRTDADLVPAGAPVEASDPAVTQDTASLPDADLSAEDSASDRYPVDVPVAPDGMLSATAVRPNKDIDGDGDDDLVVGLPFEGYPGQAPGGYIEAFEGLSGVAAPNAISAASSVLWSQDSPGVLGDPQTDDQFGQTLAIGDFNGDGFADVAIGVPGQAAAGGYARAGAVEVLFGSGGMLTSTGSTYWFMDDLDGATGPNEELSFALAASDLNGDGYDDLIIGAPGDGTAGSVTFAWGNPLWALPLPLGPQLSAERVLGSSLGLRTGDRFGAAIDVGSFDRDARLDVAIGAPGADIGAAADAGRLIVLMDVAPGSLTSGVRRFDLNTTGVLGVASAGDQLGAALATGDFNCDGYDDLAIGAPAELVQGIDNAGAVHVLYGVNGTGLTTNNDGWLYQTTATGRLAAGDRFGEALARGDYNGDRCDDLVIGAPGDGAGHEGAIHYLGGRTSRLAWSTQRRITQPTGESEADDNFGAPLSTGDFNHDGRDDLVAGIPHEDVGLLQDAGAVRVMYGASQPFASSTQLDQSTPNVAGTEEAADQFGGGLPR